MLNHLPVELITLLGSSVLGGVMRIWGASLHAKHLIHAMQIQAMSTQADIFDKIRTFENPGFMMTRRIIAIASVLSIVVLPKVAALIWPEIPIHYGYMQLEKASFFSSLVEKVLWVHHHGLVITPIDTHLTFAIIGLYFSGSLIGNYRR